MNISREFSVYRYNDYNKQRVLGKIPFFAQGPNIKKYGKLLAKEIRNVFGEGTKYDKECIAEFLLNEKVIVALWAINMKFSVEKELKRNIEITELAKDFGPVPWSSVTSKIYWDLGQAVCEYLETIPSQDMRRNYVSEDGIVLM